MGGQSWETGRGGGRGSSEKAKTEHAVSILLSLIKTCKVPVSTDYFRHIPIPEAFIWHVARGLSEVLDTFRTGLCYEAGLLKFQDTREGWKPLTHNDIKPYNIFFGEPDPVFPCYRSVKLADYGLADTSPQGMKRAGTKTYQAPVRYNQLLQSKHFTNMHDRSVSHLPTPAQTCFTDYHGNKRP